MKVFVVVLAFVALAACQPDDFVLRESFVDYIHSFGKVYQSQFEFNARFEAYKVNLAKIAVLNSRTTTATYGLTKFSDMTSEEFRHLYKMPIYRPVLPEDDSFYLHPTNIEAPASFDWRTKGAVSPVKNQEQCGSCWAFSVTEEVESQWFLAGHPLPDLAPQQIVDCDTVDQGCNGGDPPTAYAYLITAGGLESESAYPYTAEDGTCQADKSKFVTTLTGWKYACKGNNETEMVNNVAQYGPLSICVDAASWQNYQGGIITSDCGNSLDHCVELVGYATDSSNTQYWIVRNSWGTDWGESGYLRVERNKNLCGISDEVTIAIISGSSTTGGSGPSSSTSSSTSSSSSSSSSSSTGGVVGFDGLF
jgi:hypothetical protein